jgi:hypothetical protein
VTPRSHERERAASRDRSVSVALNYILVLAISSVLVTGLLIAGGSFVEDNRQRVINSELTVIGNHVAGNVEQVDRLVTASHDNLGSSADEPEAHINQSFQQEVTGSSYTIELADGSPTQIVLTSFDPDVTVSVNVTVRNDVRDESRASTSDISVYYDSDSEEIVIDDV